MVMKYGKGSELFVAGEGGRDECIGVKYGRGGVGRMQLWIGVWVWCLGSEE